MAAPVLTLANMTADGRSFNLTTLTGGAAVTGEAGGTTMIGYTEADFLYWGGIADAYRKTQGGEQLMFGTFTAGPALTEGETTYIAATWTAGDAMKGDNVNNSTGSTKAGTFNFASGQINAGLIWGNIIANQKLKVATFVCYEKPSSGTYVVTATLGDGSVAPQTLTLPTNGNCWFTCTFRSVVETNLTIEIRRTGAFADSFFIPQIMYIGVPTLPARPRGLVRTMLYNGSFGGANA